MSINHHLSEGLILAYAAGSLPEAYSLIAAAHISMCDDCRAAATAYDALGGAVIDDGDSAALCQDSLAKTFARISAPALGLPVVVTPKAPSVLPAPLQDYLGARLEDVKWRNVCMGVRQCVLKTKGSQTARLLHIPAGTAVPDHGHGGLELTLVLKGAFQTKQGVLVWVMSKLPTNRLNIRRLLTLIWTVSVWPSPMHLCGLNLFCSAHCSRFSGFNSLNGWRNRGNNWNIGLL